MIQEETKVEVERAWQLLKARGMDGWSVDPSNGRKYAEITMVHLGGTEYVVLNCAYRTAKVVLEQKEANAA
jgi:hypothetical protein